MHERVLAVKLDGPTKEDYVWGFRVGFMTFGIGAAQKPLYTALEAKLAGAVRGSISNAPNVAQSILQTAYRAPSYEQEKEEKYQMLMRRYERIRLILAQHPEYAGAFVPLPFNSGYFMCVRVVSGNAEAVQQRLLKEHATGVIAFGDLIRVAFSSTPIDKIDALFANIYRACGGA
jgi:aspartate/methionine/tyrosine aminotransferase